MLTRLDRFRTSFTLFATIFFSGLSSSSEIEASSIIAYSTSGTIGSDNLTGTPALSFQGIDNASISSPTPFRSGEFYSPVPGNNGSAFSLGSFLITPPTDGTTTGYRDTRFKISIKINSIDGAPSSSIPDSIVLEGTLDGTLSRSGLSKLSAALISTSIPGPPFSPEYSVGGFSTPNSTYTLIFPPNSVISASNPSGQISITAVLVSSTSTPEPTTLALFIVCGTGVIYGRLRKLIE